MNLRKRDGGGLLIMPETLRSSSLPATPSNTGEGGGLDRGGEPGAGLSVADAVTSCLCLPKERQGHTSHPRCFLGWKWQVQLGASMWCQLDKCKVLRSTRNQDVRMGRAVRVILTWAKARMEGFLEGKLDGEGVLVL